MGCRQEASLEEHPGLLGGSWVVLSGVISRVTILITHLPGFITTHEPPSRGQLTGSLHKLCCIGMAWKVTLSLTISMSKPASQADNGGRKDVAVYENGGPNIQPKIMLLRPFILVQRMRL